MLSLKNTCTAQDIFELNKSKEYVLTASCLLEQVTTDPNLNAQASMLWQILFNQAKFDKNLQIQISCSYLAQKLNKSTRTIQRYIKTLAKNNYIVIINNYLDNGGQTINTIAVRFPSSKIEDAKKTKDRIKLEAIDNVKQQQDCGNNVIGEGDKNVVQNNIYNINNNKINNKEQEPNPDIDKPKNQPKPNQSVVSSFDDNLNESNKIELDTSNQKITQLESELQTKQQEHNKLQEAVAKIDQEEKVLFKTKKPLPYDTMRKNNELRTALDICKMRIESQQKLLEQKIKQLDKQKQLTEDASYFFDKEGPRPISRFTFNRLQRNLEILGYNGINKIKLLNEIIFEARFGSLIKTNDTKIDMPIERSVNIALKLVREGRWCTPSGFFTKII